MTTVTCSQLKRRFGRKEALKGVDLALEAGKFYALVGANGSGKSTLMRVLMRMLAPTSGDGQVLGVSLQEDTGRANDQVGYVSEDLGYRLPLSLGAFGRMNRAALPRWDQGVFLSTLAALALDPKQRFSALSRGQRMRFFFAVAMARRPRLILLDEVSSVLDASARAYVNGQLADAARGGATVLLATNIPSEIQPSVDQVLVLKNGTIERRVVLADFRASHAKLRLAADAPPPPDGFRCGASSDGLVSYIVPTSQGPRPGTPDRRAMTAEDMVAYLMNLAAAP